jgi:DNA-binding transcriptional MerR regulator
VTPAPEYTLAQLASLVDLPERTVRYYVQLGLVDRPDGETRAARYGQRHLEELLTIRKWQRAGLSLERIRELLSDGENGAPPARPRGAGSVEVWSHLVVDDGVELTVEPARAGLSPEQLRELFREVGAIYARLRAKDLK